jgi:hypothetical protein
MLRSVFSVRLLAVLWLLPVCVRAAGQSSAILESGVVKYKVAVLGNNAEPDVEWNAANLARLRGLGFNTVQLNLAWGWRPNDEPLNIEDVIDLPADLQEKLPQVVPLRSDPSPAARALRRANLRRRIQLCRAAGMRSIFHFGAPYNAHERYGDAPPNCLMDPRVTERYVALLRAFAAEYPGVDDLLIYTYDQDAWLCNEFGPCQPSRGIPLHDRLPPFLRALTATWLKLNPKGRIWWELWELSAGQVYKCLEQFDGHGFGVAAHCNFAEVMSTLPVDRWLKNVCTLARQRDIPVMVEYNLGGASEELEPFRCAQHPLVTWRGLKAIASVPGVVGIKEYYGLVPAQEDPNLRMTALFFKNPRLDESRALQLLARPYGRAARDMAQFWTLTSEAMEFFPWDASWFFRYQGKTTPVHSMNAAFIRGKVAHTPAWESGRRAIFMKTDNAECDPWMLEDVQLRCEMASERMAAALQLGQRIKDDVPAQFAPEFTQALAELTQFRRRAVAYACHLRETNLADMMRLCMASHEPMPERLPAEMAAVLKTDQANQQQAEPIGAALALLEKDRAAFLKTYFVVPDQPLNQGGFNVTSRW